MRFAVVSDTHFGDPMCILAHWKDDSRSAAIIGPGYAEFMKAAGTQNDYLIMLGDIFDISISSYEEVYTIAKVFFEQLQKDQIAKHIIYVPGNHDADMWHFYEYQLNVIMRITAGRPPRNFRFSVPAVIDGRQTPGMDPFSLWGVSKNPTYPELGYGGMFLDHITMNEAGGGQMTGTPLNFAFAYPNIYLVTDQGTILLTHGHYLEEYWSMPADWALKVVREDLRIGDALDLGEMVAINFPFNQLACSGVGQAGPLTEIVRKVQREVKDKNLTSIKKYLENLDNEIDRLTPSRWFLDPREGLTDALSNYVKKKVLEQLANAQSTRYSEAFIHKKEVLDRFRRFFDCTLLEIDTINVAGRGSIPKPRYVIFGHTHQPIPWGDPKAPKTLSTGGSPITLYNAGGWLNHRNEKTGNLEFCGAEVFTFDSDKTPAMSSQAIK